MTEQMTKKSKDYSGEGLRRVVWVDDKSFKGMMIFTWGWMSDGLEADLQRKVYWLLGLRRMNTFSPGVCWVPGSLGKKAKFSGIQREEWNTFKYLFNIRKETILPLPMLSEATVPDDGAVINKKCIVPALMDL